MRYFLILLLSTTTYAQDLDSLELIYNSKMLIIQTHRGGWKPILGYNPINEEQFFSIAGMSREDQIVRSKMSFGKHLIFAGIGSAVLGGVLFAKNRDKESDIQLMGVNHPRHEWIITVTEEGNKQLRIVGYFGVGTAIILTMIGGKKMSSNWAPKERAEDIAYLYNKKLRKQLGLKPNK